MENVTKEGIVLPDRRREPPRVYVEEILRVEYAIGDGTKADPVRIVTAWYRPLGKGMPQLLFVRNGDEE